MPVRVTSKYPHIFPKDRPVEFSIGEGWHHLVDVLCDGIQTYCDKNKDKVEQVVATQVKEKFGGLRFNYMGGDTTIDALVSMIEFVSLSHCELCGDKAGPTRAIHGWVVTRCDACM